MKLYADNDFWYSGKWLGNQDQENRSNVLYKQDIPFKNNKLSRYIRCFSYFTSCNM